MDKLILVGLGGFLGAVFRYLVVTVLKNYSEFALATLFVNVVGSFFIVFLLEFWLSKSSLDELLRLFLVVGFLGAFTTFSSFSLETFAFIKSGLFYKAALNVLLNNVLCLLAAFLGYFVAIRL